MESINLSMDPETLRWAQQLAADKGCTLDELFAAFVKQHQPVVAATGGLIGLFANEPEIMDAVMEDVYKTRETQTLRGS